MAKVSAAKLRANNKYMKKTYKQFNIRFNKNTESEFIDHLNKQESLAKYIKNLILEDMNKG